jgi:hypothetical protein
MKADNGLHKRTATSVTEVTSDALGIPKVDGEPNFSTDHSLGPVVCGSQGRCRKDHWMAMRGLGVLAVGEATW